MYELKDVYTLGGRRIGVFGLPPLGCLPSQRTFEGGAERECVDSYNGAAEMFNHKLSAEMRSLDSQYPEATLVYVDIYDLALDLIHYPHKYGMFINLVLCQIFR